MRDRLPDLSIFRNMDTATARMAKAMTARENIVVFGNDDVDGATGAAPLVRRECCQ